MADDDAPINGSNDETVTASSVASITNCDECDCTRAGAPRSPLSPSSVNATTANNVGVGINGDGDIDYVDDGSDTTTLRRKMGKTLAAISDAVNENLIVVRYATLSTVLLLGAYGVANTPLFYQYKHVMDIPQKMFVGRKWIHGRIVGIAGNENWGTNSARGKSVIRQSSNGIAPVPYSSSTLGAARTEENGRSSSSDKYRGDTPDLQIQHTQSPIVVLFRHASPMERFLIQFTGRSPSSALFSSSNHRRNLLHIELAGVSSPPSHSSSNMSASLSTSPNQFPLLDQLIHQNAKVSLQLIAQRVNSTNLNLARASVGSYEKDGTGSEDDKRTAICHLHYQRPKQWFASTSASLELVRSGQAWINCGGVAAPLSSVDGRNGSIILNFNPSAKQLQDDAKFISELERAEYSSWKSKAGMWSSDHMRRLRGEYLEEEERANNKWRVWNMLKRGWEWMRK